MKTTVKINQVFQNGNHQMLLLENQNYFPLELDTSKVYRIEINELKSKRSLEQNRKLWKGIHEVSLKLGQDDMKTYCDLLEEADVKSDYIMSTFNIEKELNKQFRGVRFIRKAIENGKEFYIYKVYFGSSTMNTKECYELIEKLEKYMSELGILKEWENYYGIPENK